MTEPALVPLLACAACADAAFLTEGADADPFFVVSGPVDPSVAPSEEPLRAAVAWAVWSDGELSAHAEEVPFEPGVLAYALSVRGPPERSAPGTSYPPLEDTDGAVGFGVPLLVEGPVDVEVEAPGLADFVLGLSDSLAGVLGAGEGRVVAVTGAHALLVASPDAAAPNGSACRAGALVAGLTLYRDDGPGCDGWQPIAPPGERTEFQGIPMTAPP